MPQPIEELPNIFSLSQNVLFSTSLQPRGIYVEELNAWPYFAELHGQHISFYTHESMEFIAKKFNYFYYFLCTSDLFQLHLFTNKKIENTNVERFSRQKRSFPYRLKNKLLKLVEETYDFLFHEQETDIHLNCLIPQDLEHIEKILLRKDL